MISEKYHPYKIQLVQELAGDDFDRQIKYYERLMDISNDDEHFAANIMFSHDATFCLNRIVNRHNYQIGQMRISSFQMLNARITLNL